MSTTPRSSFVALLEEQVRHEFTASQQYIAIAVWFDDLDLPRLAERFYAQSVEERNHAMMMVRYMLDRDWSVEIPGVDPVRNTFARPAEPIALAYAQEQGSPSSARRSSAPLVPRATSSASSSCSGSSRSRSRRSRR